jgi:hypothetical protein
MLDVATCGEADVPTSMYSIDISIQVDAGYFAVCTNCKHRSSSRRISAAGSSDEVITRTVQYLQV